MVKTSAIITQNINCFYHILNFIPKLQNSLTIIFQCKSKLPGKQWELRCLIVRKSNLNQLYQLFEYDVWWNLELLKV